VWQAESSNQTPRYRVNNAPLTVCLPARQARRCCYVIIVCAIETRFHSLQATAAARICFAYMHPQTHPAPVHCTGVGPAGTTTAFDTGVIGGKDQIHAVHGHTHA